MKTKNKRSLVALFFLVSLSSLAQEMEPTYASDIGFNTTFLFQGILQSNETPFSIMYKKYTSENKATRFGLDLFLNLNDETNNQALSNDTDNSSASISLNMGREIQKPITLKWTWFYGGDIIPFYQFSRQEQFQNHQKYFTYKSSGFGVTLRPFLAIRYNLHPRIYLSAEASINLKYRRLSQFSKYTQTDLAERDSDANNISFFASPASGLYLFYRF